MENQQQSSDQLSTKYQKEIQRLKNLIEKKEDDYLHQIKSLQSQLNDQKEQNEKLQKMHEDVLNDHNMVIDHKEKLSYDKDNFFKLISIQKDRKSILENELQKNQQEFQKYEGILSYERQKNVFLEQQNQKLQNELENFKQKLQQQNDDKELIENQKYEIIELEQKSKQFQNENLKLKADIEKYIQDVKEYQRHKVQMKLEQAVKEKLHLQLKQHYQDVEKNKQTLQETNEQLQSHKSLLSFQNTLKEQQDQQIKQLTIELAQKQDLNNKTTEKLAQNQKMLKDEQELRNKEKQELEMMRKEYEQMKIYVAEWTSEVKEIRHYNNVIESQQKDISLFQQQVQALQDSNSKYLKQIQDFNSVISQNQEDLKNQKDQIEVLKLENLNFKQKIEKQKIIIAEQNKKLEVVTKKEEQVELKQKEEMLLQIIQPQLFDSKIIFHADLYAQMFILIPNQINFLGFTLNPKSLRLLYRGSRDGFTSKQFRDSCGGQGSTITFVKANKSNQIFGGFTDIPWSIDQQQISKKQGNHKSFLFKIDNEKRKVEQLKHKLDRNDEVTHGNELLASFSHDLYIQDNCNILSSNSSHIGLDYEAPEGFEYHSQQAKDYLAGQHHFTVSEIEVFLVVYL